jgi:hypothetical protein
MDKNDLEEVKKAVEEIRVEGEGLRKSFAGVVGGAGGEVRMMENSENLGIKHNLRPRHADSSE